MAEITWLGHASALVDIDGQRVLIDPLGRRRCADLPSYHTILITHAHVDHLNRWTLKKLDREARLVVPHGAEPIVRDLGFRDVVEVKPGDEFFAGDLEVTCVPTRHDRGRWRKSHTPECTGYVVSKAGVSLHHAGDVDMSDFVVFDDIGKRFALAATLLPIGGMLPVWYYRWRRRTFDRGVHIDPDTALHIFERLGAQAMVPIHWGTIHLRLGPPSAPKKRLTHVASSSPLNSLVRVLGHGEALPLIQRSET